MSNESAANISEGPSSSENITDPKKPVTQCEKTFALYRSLILSECGIKVTCTENHIKRLVNLRKELNYISDTDWMYETVDKKASQ